MDIKGYFCKYYYFISLALVKKVATLFVKIKVILFGINIGKNCEFYGNMRLYRKPFTTINIGNNCQFRSISDSNLIGINHKCIISTLKEGAKIIIGNNCGFSGTVIGAFTEINIGDNVMCGANTTITDGDWHSEDSRTGISKPVRIHDNVWLGLNVTVWKGVTIGKNSFIGANSIVTKDIPENVVAAGNPCRIIKSIFQKTNNRE